MLIGLDTAMTQQCVGRVWADARACAAPAMPSLTHRTPVDAIGGFYGTGVSKNGTTMRPKGLGGSAG